MRVLLEWGIDGNLAGAAAVGAALIVAIVVHKIIEVPSQALGRRHGKALTGVAHWNLLHAGTDVGAIARKFPPPATQPLVARPAALR
jgi:peptidoglycan/LPS O-acetylase OafA/YrhL